VLHVPDGRQAVLLRDHGAVGHQAAHLRDQALDDDEQRRPAEGRVGGVVTRISPPLQLAFAFPSRYLCNQMND
jgi:hypothetical protein